MDVGEAEFWDGKFGGEKSADGREWEPQGGVEKGAQADSGSARENATLLAPATLQRYPARYALLLAASLEIFCGFIH